MGKKTSMISDTKGMKVSSEFQCSMLLPATTVDDKGFFLSALFTIRPSTGKYRGKLSSLSLPTHHHDHNNQIGSKTTFPDPQTVHDFVNGVARNEIRALASSMTIQQVFNRPTLFSQKFLLGVYHQLYPFGLVIHGSKIDQPQYEENSIIPIPHNKPSCFQFHSHLSSKLTKKSSSERLQGKLNRCIASFCSKITKKKKGPFQPKKSTKYNHDERVTEPAPSPSLMIKNAVESMGGSDLMWVDKKLITDTDVNASQHRLYLPNPVEKVLTETEKQHLQYKLLNDMQVLVVDHMGMKWDMTVRYWPSVRRYVLVKNWPEFVRALGIQHGENTVVEIWSFRRLLTQEDIGEKSQLCFAFNFPRLASNSSGSISNGVDEGGTGGQESREKQMLQ